MTSAVNSWYVSASLKVPPMRKPPGTVVTCATRTSSVLVNLLAASGEVEMVNVSREPTSSRRLRSSPTPFIDTSRIFAGPTSSATRPAKVQAAPALTARRSAARRSVESGIFVTREHPAAGGPRSEF